MQLLSSFGKRTINVKVVHMIYMIYMFSQIIWDIFIKLSFASFFEVIIVTAWKERPVHSAKCTQKRKSYKFGTT